MARVWSARKKFSLRYGNGDGDFDFLHAFGDNGWIWIGGDYEIQHNEGTDKYGHVVDDDDEYACYYAQFLNMYSSEIYAVVPRNKEPTGELGIAWLSLRKYENDNTPLSWWDLNDIQGSFIIAEENLLRAGIPFCSDYKFHGKNAYQKKQKNLALRKRYGMENYVPWEERYPRNGEKNGSDE